MTRVLLLGNGAREHAIAKVLSKSDVELHAHMERKNPGIAGLCREYSIGSITEQTKLPDLFGIDYAIIGPEAPLEAGISDFIVSQGVPCIGPRKAAAMIETSKSFARIVLDQVDQKANPRFKVTRSIDDLRRFEDKIGVENIVVKPNGLTGGKGVKIFGEHLQTRDELEKYAIDLITKTGVVVLEEKLVGTEFTMQAYTDGRRLQFMPLVRDYKRAYDGDVGPNTGSMGSLSMPNHGLPYVTQEDYERAKEIMESTILGIKKKAGSIYKGILYGQFMKTKEGVKVIEFNARLGDPEAMNVLSIQSTPMDDICQSIIDEKLTNVQFENKATVCVYIVPEGYPGPNSVKDSPIDLNVKTEAEIYYASVYEKDGEILTTGSRAIGVLGIGDNIKQARETAYANTLRIKGKLRYRSDIAK